jgi:hypothetical protein
MTDDDEQLLKRISKIEKEFRMPLCCAVIGTDQTHNKKGQLNTINVLIYPNSHEAPFVEKELNSIF